MEKYYDQRCPDCDTCGWRKTGSYPNGKSYEACEWYGYILHESVMARCEGFATPQGVAEFKSQYARKNKGKKCVTR